jgi:hypothetical protein
MNERKPARTEQWHLDPNDVRRHAQLRRQREHVGPLGKIVRYAGVAVVLAAGFAVYWNFATLRQVVIDVPVLARLFPDDSGVGGTRVFGGEPTTEAVEGAGVVGAALPSSIDELPPTAEATVAIDTASGAEPAPTAAVESPAAEVPPPPAEPELPPEPERFEFGLSTVAVSESAASAAVIVLRSGGRRGLSSVTWWTTDGTATAGVDYANLGRVDMKFAAGEQNHTIRVPIVGDRNVEGPETFYVNLAASDTTGTPTDAQRLEVVINDDD